MPLTLRITQSKRALLLSAAVAVLILGSITALGHEYVFNKQEASARTAANTTKTADLTAAAKAKQAAAAVAKKIDSSPTSPEESNTSATASKQTTTTAKYATSSDPRSTAYSTTLPAPNPASFDIAITRNGQVASGTVITYNASKGEKGYYAGDLVFSRQSITLSKSQYMDPYFMVTIPDGQTAGAPAAPWNDTNRSVYASFNASPLSGTSWQMFVHLAGDTASGTYTVHLTTSRSGQTADAWYYHGFLTVTVID